MLGSRRGTLTVRDGLLLVGLTPLGMTLLPPDIVNQFRAGWGRADHPYGSVAALALRATVPFWFLASLVVSVAAARLASGPQRTTTDPTARWWVAAVGLSGLAIATHAAWIIGRATAAHYWLRLSWNLVAIELLFPPALLGICLCLRNLPDGAARRSGLRSSLLVLVGGWIALLVAHTGILMVRSG